MLEKAKHDLIILANKIVGQFGVVHLARGGFDPVHEAAFGIHANMGFKAKIPLIALL